MKKQLSKRVAAMLLSLVMLWGIGIMPVVAQGTSTQPVGTTSEVGAFEAPQGEAAAQAVEKEETESAATSSAPVESTAICSEKEEPESSVTALSPEIEELVPEPGIEARRARRAMPDGAEEQEPALAPVEGRTLAVTPRMGMDALKAQIESYSSGTGSFAATLDTVNNYVTVTGDITDATAPLNLNLDTGISLLWSANMSGTGDLLQLTGAGWFSMENCTISTTSGTAFYSEVGGQTYNVRISTENGIAIQYNNITDNNYSITIQDSLITASSGTAIAAQTPVTIAGEGTIVSAPGYGDVAIDVNVSNNPVAKVSVLFGAQVQATGDNGIAIVSNIDVWVNVRATVTAVGANGVAIQQNNPSASTQVTFAKVYATGDNGNAILTAGSVTMDQAAQVVAIGPGSHAIQGTNNSVTVAVNGGVVFAPQPNPADTTILSPIYLPGAPAGAVSITGLGMVIGWDAQLPNTYQLGSSTSLTYLPANTTVVWAQQDGQNGISYANTDENIGENTGFIPLNVNLITQEVIAVTVTQADGTYGTPLDDPQPPTDPALQNATYTYVYKGVPGITQYGPSSEKPIRAGSYTVATTLVNSQYYGTGITNFIIRPKNISWDTSGLVANKTYDGTTTATLVTVPQLLGIVSNNGVLDDVQTVQGTTFFASADAANSAEVIADGWTITGADAYCYSVIASPLIKPATISPLELEATAQATNREYNGTTMIAVTLTPTNLLQGDDVTLTATGNTETPDVGADKPVTLTDIQMNGADAGNYILQDIPRPLVNITKLKTGLIATTPDEIVILSSSVQTNTLDLATVLKPNIILPSANVVVEYSLGNFENSAEVLAEAPALSGSVLSYKGSGKTSGVATQEIIVSSANCESIKVNITFEAAEAPASSSSTSASSTTMVSSASEASSTTPAPPAPESASAARSRTVRRGNLGVPMAAGEDTTSSVPVESKSSSSQSSVSSSGAANSSSSVSSGTSVNNAAAEREKTLKGLKEKGVPVLNVFGFQLAVYGTEGSQVWSLTNLILVVIGLLVCVPLFLRLFTGAAKECPADIRKRQLLLKGVSMLVCIFSVILFFAVERLPYLVVLFDSVSPVFALLFVAQIGLLVAARISENRRTEA